MSVFATFGVQSNLLLIPGGGISVLAKAICTLCDLKQSASVLFRRRQVVGFSPAETRSPGEFNRQNDLVLGLHPDLPAAAVGRGLQGCRRGQRAGVFLF